MTEESKEFPQSSTAEQPPLAEMCRLWAEVLQVQQVGPDDDFFELGGDSLLAVELAQLIDTRAGTSIELADFFLNPTPSALVDAANRNGAASTRLSLEDQ